MCLSFGGNNLVAVEFSPNDADKYRTAIVESANRELDESTGSKPPVATERSINGRSERTCGDANVSHGGQVKPTTDNQATSDKQGERHFQLASKRPLAISFGAKKLMLLLANHANIPFGPLATDATTTTTNSTSGDDDGGAAKGPESAGLSPQQARQEQPLEECCNAIALSTANIAASTGGLASAASISAAIESKREKKAAKTLAIITGVFVMCWLPFFVMAIAMPVLDLRPHKYLFAFLLWLGYANSMLNPIIYTIFSPDFRKAFKRICGLDGQPASGPSGRANNACSQRLGGNHKRQQSLEAPQQAPGGPLTRLGRQLCDSANKLSSSLLGLQWLSRNRRNQRRNANNGSPDSLESGSLGLACQQQQQQSTWTAGCNLSNNIETKAQDNKLACNTVVECNANSVNGHGIGQTSVRPSMPQSVTQNQRLIRNDF